MTRARNYFLGKKREKSGLKEIEKKILEVKKLREKKKILHGMLPELAPKPSKRKMDAFSVLMSPPKDSEMTRKRAVKRKKTQVGNRTYKRHVTLSIHNPTSVTPGRCRFGGASAGDNRRWREAGEVL